MTIIEFLGIDGVTTERCIAVYRRVANRRAHRCAPAYREQSRAYTAEYRKRFPEKVKASLVKARAKNREKDLVRTRAWRRNNPAWFKRYQEANRGKAVAYAAKRRALQFNGTVRPDLVQAFIQRIRNKKLAACYYCGKRMSGRMAHIDHIVPLSKGGKHCVENLCASCAPCNRSKSAKLPEHFQSGGQLLMPLPPLGMDMMSLPPRARLILGVNVLGRNERVHKRRMQILTALRRDTFFNVIAARPREIGAVSGRGAKDLVYLARWGFVRKIANPQTTEHHSNYRYVLADKGVALMKELERSEQ